MSQADELLDSLTEPEVETYSVNPDTESHIVINADRTITVPDELKHIAVQGEHNIETVTFDCPRYWDGHDLSQMSVRINYQRPDGHREPHLAESLRVDDTDTSLIHFDWTISGNVTAVKGNISFMVCAKIADAEGITEREWHSRLNQDLLIDEGLECSGDEIVEQNPDILESILSRLDTLESPGGTGSSSGENVAQMEPEYGDRPLVFITGVKPTTKDNVLAELVYISKGTIIKAYVKIKYQGSSSMNYAKKNFTVTLYQDEARTIPLYLEFKDWGIKINKFVLKANWIDHSHARNICTVQLWSDMVASRPDYDTLPVELRNSPRNGAIDGFPIQVYYNGTYEGLYTWNIGKEPWQLGMSEDNPNHVVLSCGSNDNTGASAFRALWGGGTGWEYEVGDNPDAVTALDNLIQFVMDNDGDDFRNGLGEFVDVQSAIDYYILAYEDCGIDSLGKNILLATYDCKKWYFSAYDKDSTWGLYWNGQGWHPATLACPEGYEMHSSLFFEKLERNFAPELIEHQARHRKGALSYANILNTFERFMGQIPKEVYDQDREAYPDVPQFTSNNISQIRSFVRDRQAYVDAEFAAMRPPVPATSVTLSASTLTFDSTEAQTLTATVEPSDSTDAVVWTSSNPDIVTVTDGVVKPVANGSATITATAGYVSAECAVTVAFAEMACTGISLDRTEINAKSAGKYTLTATVTPEDTTDKITWSSDNEDVATVADGVVDVKSHGTAVIIATCGAYSASCTVTASEFALYPLKNGTYGSQFVVTDGYHVTRNSNGENTPGALYLRLNSSTGADNNGFTVSEAWFSLKSGDVVTLSVKDVGYGSGHTANGAGLRIGLVCVDGITKPLGEMGESDGTKTVTLTADYDIGYVQMFFYQSPTAAHDCWFDVGLTVNGVRYI